MKKLFAGIISTALAASSSFAATVAYYEFNGTGTASIGSSILDSAGGHNGTVTGGDLVYGLDPMVGSYLSFAADGPSVSGLGNRVVVSGSTDFLFDITSAYTIEVIFRTTQTATNGVLISKGADVSNPDSQWWIRHQGNGQLRVDMEGFDNTTEDVATSTGTPLINDGLWHSMAMVYDGTGGTKHLDLYIDGSLRASDTSIGTLGISGGDDNDPVVIGEYASLAANRSFAGDIAAVRLSNAALSAGDFLAVPEPSTFLLLATALAGGMLARRFVRA